MAGSRKMQTVRPMPRPTSSQSRSAATRRAALSVATFGSYCGVSDLRAISYANQLCNMYGVDSISCGATLAWAMDCYEHGVFTQEELDGIDLRFGNAEGMIAILEKTLKREGIGDALAMGSAKAADYLGKGHDYLMTTKDHSTDGFHPNP